MHESESIFIFISEEILTANDELDSALGKYLKVIVLGKKDNDGANSNNSAVGSGSSLLDLSTPSEELLPPPVSSLLNEQFANLGKWYFFKFYIYPCCSSWV